MYQCFGLLAPVCFSTCKQSITLKFTDNLRITQITTLTLPITYKYTTGFTINDFLFFNGASLQSQFYTLNF